MPGPVESCVILFLLLWSCWLHSLWVIHASSFSCASSHGLSSHSIPVNLIGSEWLHARSSHVSYGSGSHSGSVELAGGEQFLLQDSAVFFHNLFTQPGPVGFLGCEWLHAQSSYDCFYNTSSLFGSIALILGCEWLYYRSSCIFSHSLYQFLL